MINGFCLFSSGDPFSFGSVGEVENSNAKGTISLARRRQIPETTWCIGLQPPLVRVVPGSHEY